MSTEPRPNADEDASPRRREPTALREQSGRLPRVAHVTHGLRCGGSERQFVNLLNNFQCGARFAVFLGQPGEDQLGALLDGDVPRFSIPVRHRNLPLSLWKLSRLFRRLELDVVHSHGYWPNLCGTVAARMARVPAVLTCEHGENPWKDPVHRWMERRIISPIADARVCVSEEILEVRARADGVPRGKLVHISNGTPLRPPVPIRDRDPLVIGTVGRLVPAKDYPTLLRAARLLLERGVRFDLRLVGEGPERPSLEREAKELGLGSAVTFAGFQSEVDAWFGDFDLFVLTSVQEGQPLALLEAMAHGLPIVATRVGGIPKTVEDGREAVLVEPGDPGQVASALEALGRDLPRRRRLAGAAHGRLAEQFSIGAVAGRYMALYESILSRKHALERRRGVA